LPCLLKPFLRIWVDLHSGHCILISSIHSSIMQRQTSLGDDKKLGID